MEWGSIQTLWSSSLDENTQGCARKVADVQMITTSDQTIIQITRGLTNIHKT